MPETAVTVEISEAALNLASLIADKRCHIVGDLVAIAFCYL